MKSIDKVEYYKQGELIQVSMKDKVEYIIIRENRGQFKLAHLLPLLEGDLYEELSILGKGKLSKDVLQDCTASQEYLEIKEVMQLFTTG